MIIGDKKLEQRLKRMSALDLKPSVDKAVSLVQQSAKELCPVNHGELRQSIYINIETEGDTCRGICYTNKKYAQFVEFGTGPNGQASHAGVSPDVNYAYGQSGWMIPAYAMSLREAEGYGLGVAEDEDGEVIGYYTNGQPAKPFMYPALKDNEDEVVEIISEGIRRQI